MSDDKIPDEPPTDEVERAKWTIRRLVLATTGKVLSQAETDQLFATAQERMRSAMAGVTPGSST